MAVTYSEKLKDPRWQKLRLEVLNRDNWMCQFCYNTEKTLHVHHLSYEKFYENPWDYPIFYLRTLCEDCHNQEVAKIKVQEENIIRNIRLKTIYLSNYQTLNNLLSHHSSDFLFKLFSVYADTYLSDEELMDNILHLNELNYKKRKEVLLSKQEENG